MNTRQRESRRSRKALFDAAVLVAVPVTIILGFGLAVGFYFLHNEIDHRVHDRQVVTGHLHDADVRIQRQAFAQCQRTRANRDGLIRVLRRATAPQPGMTDTQRRAAKKFFNQSLKDLPPVHCPPRTKGKPR